MAILAVDIGGTKLAMAVFDGEKIVDRFQTATDRAGGRVWMIEQITKQARIWSAQHKLDRCGIGFGGPVDFEQQRVFRSTHVAGWADCPIAQVVADNLRMAAVVDNDANLGALGEAEFGAGKGIRPMLYITLSTGIGGGIVLADGLYRGADTMAGTIGHIPVDPDGPMCDCGQVGCLEALCGGMALEKHRGRSAQDLLKDPAFVAAYVVDLATGLKTALMLLNPARVVIGGGISKAGAALFTPLRLALARIMPPGFKNRVDLQPAKLGGDSVLYGAMALARMMST